MRIAIIGGGISGLAAAHRIIELLARDELSVGLPQRIHSGEAAAEHVAAWLRSRD